MPDGQPSTYRTVNKSSIKSHPVVLSNITVHSDSIAMTLPRLDGLEACLLYTAIWI